MCIRDRARSFRNLSRVNVLSAEAVGVADIVNAATLVAPQSAIDAHTVRGSRAKPGGEAPAETGREREHSKEASA